MEAVTKTRSKTQDFLSTRLRVKLKLNSWLKTRSESPSEWHSWLKPGLSGLLTPHLWWLHRHADVRGHADIVLLIYWWYSAHFLLCGLYQVTLTSFAACQRETSQLLKHHCDSLTVNNVQYVTLVCLSQKNCWNCSCCMHYIVNITHWHTQCAKRSKKPKIKCTTRFPVYILTPWVLVL